MQPQQEPPPAGLGLRMVRGRYHPRSGMTMQRRLTIGNKLFLSTLFILIVTFLILLYTTISTIEGSLTKEISKDLETNLKFARSQYL